ncbi:MAG: tyrosine-protein phosphatase [Synergistaceae bacterium]|nr:tyrosine-protein phosphatase [Synergistaceae bacterium]
MKYNVIILSLLMCLFIFSFKGEADTDLQKNQSINLQSIGNARELGGYVAGDGRKVKRGVLLRTASLNKISSDDIARLTKIYNLSVIADLRMSFEAAAKPDPVIEGVKYVNLRVIDEELYMRKLEKILSGEKDPFEILKITVNSGMISDNIYIDFLSGNFGKKAYSEFFKELLNLPEGRSLLFHCTQGKDRTGCAAMLILSALGVSEDIILEDYMLTNIFNAGLIENDRKMLLSRGIKEDELKKYMFVLNSVNIEMMTNALSWLKENYGSPVGYIIHELGINENEIEKLKSKFLERE